MKTLNLQSGHLNISGIGTAGSLEVAADGLTFAGGTGIVMDIGSIQDQLNLNQSVDFGGQRFVLGLSCGRCGRGYPS